MVSNILGTMATALIIFVICIGYVQFHDETLPNKNAETSRGINRLTKMMNILYTYEEEISGMDWETVLREGSQEMLAKIGSDAEEASYMTEAGIIVRDRISYAHKIWYVTAVYNEDRVDKGVQSSITPLFLVPHGIGLAIVKGIIEGHGGQVSASSENGLCITMTLPSVKRENKHEEDSDR